MANLNLWDDLKRWKSECEFVELSHEFSPETPHWSGFPAMSYEKIFDYEVGFRVHKVTGLPSTARTWTRRGTSYPARACSMSCAQTNWCCRWW